MRQSKEYSNKCLECKHCVLSIPGRTVVILCDLKNKCIFRRKKDDKADNIDKIFLPKVDKA